MTLRDYIESLRHKTVAVIGIGVSNTPLLELLLRSQGRVVPKEQLLLKVWGYDSDAEDNNVEVYISFLRRKLTHLHSAVSIRTRRMVGYYLEVEA